RDRLEDLPLLARHFLASYAKREGRKLSITDAALERMKGYHWPGNVRELRNFMHRTAIMVDDRAIDVDCLPPFEVQSTVGSGSVADRYPEGGPQAPAVATDAPAPEAGRSATSAEAAAARPDANEMP